MLGQTNPIATIGVKDLEVAKKFYEEKLGLSPLKSPMPTEVQMYKCGETMIEVYHSEFAGTNKATALTFNVGENIMEEVQELKAKGIEFEHYDMPDMEIRNDVHVSSDIKVAWFKDPDGNIISLVDH